MKAFFLFGEKYATGGKTIAEKSKQ